MGDTDEELLVLRRDESRGHRLEEPACEEDQPDIDRQSHRAHADHPGDRGGIPLRSPVEEAVEGVEKPAQQHLWETKGYGKNPMFRDYPQPSPNDDAKARLWMQFRDLMEMGQQRFVERNNKFSMSWHKIKSVPLETRFEMRNYNWLIPNCKESFQVFIM